MNNTRHLKLAAAYQRELSDLLCYRIKDPRLSGVYITHVVLTHDLGLARVYYNVPEGRVREQEVKDGFEKSKSFIRREISHRVKIKYTPDLVFYYDDREEITEGIDQLFEKIARQKDEPGKKNNV
ncbi:MAG: 30S ribosome-binding factor RbfA [Deltaproteobacteria bacterium]|nr:30S ribosome-binding factor RbfA [Deltaproteobacteria bacterium]